jgi:hypothetical protein
MKTFKQYVEIRDSQPETDDEAKVKLPQDVRLQGMYDTLRRKGKKPGQAWNAVIQHNWQMKKAGMTEAIFDPDTGKYLRHDDRMERLRSIYQKYGDNAYVSMTMLNKLGINPKKNPKKTTPYGIFGYQLGWFLGEVGDGDFNSLPYGGGFPYMQIFVIKPNAVILHFHERVNASKLLGYFGEKQERLMAKKFLMYDELKDYAETHGLEWNPEAALYQMEAGLEKPSEGSLLWIMTRWWAEDNKARWNKILRDLGIDGVVDHGTSTAHEIDPTQAVIFNPNAIEHIDVVQNAPRLDMSKWRDEKTGQHEPTSHQGHATNPITAPFASTSHSSLVGSTPPLG